MSNSNVIPGFESLTMQQMFDMAAKHVLKNGKASVDPDGQCAYTGIGCAASPFLTKRARSLISGSWGALVRRSHVPSDNRNFIQQLQNCHDIHAMESDFIHRFKADMEGVARNYGLNTFVLDETQSVSPEIETQTVSVETWRGE